jgi:hypothetical protein
MKPLPLPGRRPSWRWLTLPATSLMILAATGCASPRLPRPPSLNLPQVVQDLHAQRAGGQVALRWTTPERTTDRLAVKGPVTAAICRIEHPDARPAPVCVAIARVPVSPGASQAADLLPQALTTGPPVLLAYRIQLFNMHGRTAGLSPQAFAAAGAAPPQVEELRASPARSGITLEWQRQNIAAPVELERLLLNAPSATPRTANPAKTTSHSGAATKTRSSHPSASKPGQAVPPAPNEVELRTPSQAPGQSPDPGGTLDPTTARGETYRYTAQRVLTTTLDGHTLTMRSVLSAPVTVVMRDIFPPAVPTGLEAVPAEADSAGSPTNSSSASSSPGNASANSSIDLSWTPDTDLDLAGYVVYRQEVSPSGALTGPAIRLNRAPIPGPAYSDQTAVTGQRYAYRVTAIDSSGNESAPSADVQETIRER